MCKEYVGDGFGVADNVSIQAVSRYCLCAELISGKSDNSSSAVSDERQKCPAQSSLARMMVEVCYADLADIFCMAT